MWEEMGPRGGVMAGWDLTRHGEPHFVAQGTESRQKESTRTQASCALVCQLDTLPAWPPV